MGFDALELRAKEKQYAAELDAKVRTSAAALPPSEPQTAALSARGVGLVGDGSPNREVRT